MSAATAPAALAPGAPGGWWPGRTFVGPGFDYLVIGGGLSLLLTAAFLARPGLSGTMLLAVPWLLLVANSAHFAASTVRLYARPGAFEQFPFLTLALPLVSLAVVAVTAAFPDVLGRSFWSLYLTWSPYHYAAQAYGLSVIYSMRSGCALGDVERRWLRRASLTIFAYAFVAAGSESGLPWLLETTGTRLPAPLAAAMPLVLRALATLALAAPFVLFAWLRWARGRTVPAIVPLLLLSNAVWWVTLSWLQAFAWATVAHALQYLAIAVLSHVREAGSRPGNTHGAAWHAAWFYGCSLLLGYALFYALPWSFQTVGFGRAESVLMTIAAINVHHFVVDAYVWRVRSDRAAAAPVAA